MTRWFWTSAFLAAALVGVMIWQERCFSQLRTDLQITQLLLIEGERQLSKSKEIIADETWQMTELVDMQTRERMLPGYLGFYNTIDANLRDVELALNDLKTNSSSNFGSKFIAVYNRKRDDILNSFSRFIVEHGPTMGMTEDEMTLSSNCDFIAGLFLYDLRLIFARGGVQSEYFQSAILTWLENHIAILAYEMKLQTFAFASQRLYFPSLSPQIHFPHTNINQGDNLEARVDVAYKLDNLNPKYNYLLLNGDTLSIQENQFANFEIPTAIRGTQQLEITFYGWDILSRQMEESTVVYSYDVMPAE
ncbi:MAG: hypothetical protein AAF433_19900 [Bacteroidota bacterium]